MTHPTPPLHDPPHPTPTWPTPPHPYMRHLTPPLHDPPHPPLHDPPHPTPTWHTPPTPTWHTPPLHDPPTPPYPTPPLHDPPTLPYPLVHFWAQRSLFSWAASLCLPFGRQKEGFLQKCSWLGPNWSWIQVALHKWPTPVHYCPHVFGSFSINSKEPLQSWIAHRRRPFLSSKFNA